MQGLANLLQREEICGLLRDIIDVSAYHLHEGLYWHTNSLVVSEEVAYYDEPDARAKTSIV